jgi:hypothetical protein
LAFRAKGEKSHTNHNIDNGVVAVHEASPFVSPFFGTFDISYQKPIAVQHFKSTKESTISVTSQMVNSAIAAIRPGRSKHNEKQMVDYRSMEDYSLSLL